MPDSTNTPMSPTMRSRRAWAAGAPMGLLQPTRPCPFIDSFGERCTQPYCGGAKFDWDNMYWGANSFSSNLEWPSLQDIVTTNNVTPVGEDTPRTPDAPTSYHPSSPGPTFDPWQLTLLSTQQLQGICEFLFAPGPYPPGIMRANPQQPNTPSNADSPTINGNVHSGGHPAVPGPQQESHHLHPDIFPSSTNSAVAGDYVPPFYLQVEDQDWDLSLMDTSGINATLQESDWSVMDVQQGLSTLHL